MAGVNVGKVKKKKLDKGGRAHDRRRSRSSRSTRRSPRTRARSCARRRCSARPTSSCRRATSRPATLPDGGRLANTPGGADRRARRDLLGRSTSRRARRSRTGSTSSPRRSSTLAGPAARTSTTRSATCPGFAVDGTTLLKTLDQQDIAVRHLIKNTGVVFGAINQRQGALRELILNANNVFAATASRDEALAETFSDLPDLPRRVEGHAGAARALLAQRAPARQRPEAARRRPRPDRPRPGRARRPTSRTCSATWIR